MSLKLVYFKMRALAEAPQFLLHYLNINYEYLMSWEYFKKEWSLVKQSVSFKQLPILMVNDKHEIAQSISILLYIEKIAHYETKDPIQAAKENSILQSAQELFAPLNPTVNFAIKDDFIKKRDAMLPFLNSRFEDLQKILESSGKKFFGGNQPKACDFAVFHHLDLSKKLDDGLIKKFLFLERFVEDISSIGTIEAYLKKRPKLIDVSIKPQLLINGVPHPTGVNQT